MEPAVALARLLGEDRVLGGAAAGRAYDCDAYSVDRSPPAAVVLPQTTEETALAVRWCIENGLPYTPRGAGTGLSGGSLPALGGVVVSSKRMTRTLETDLPNRAVRVQAGAVNARINEALKPHGLHYAPDPSSQSVATIGGGIGENSGGPHTLKYGVTAQHVLGVTMVTPEGEILEIGGPVPGAGGMDLLSLVVGGEGTTGIVTEAWLKLTPLPTRVETCLIAFGTVRGATEAVAAIMAAGVVPAALEMVDHGILGALRAAFGLEFPEGSQALLLVECDGDDAGPEMGRVVEVARAGGAFDVRVAQDAKERAALWTARKKGVGAMGRLAPSVVTHDGVIPRSKLPEMLETVYAVAGAHGIGVANIFHAGDGNLHPCFYFDDRDPAQVAAVVEAGEAIIRRCVELGGSISGEHGVGVEKSDLLPLMFDENDLRVQHLAKRVFGESPYANPCKVLPNQRGCSEHRSRWRGVAW